MTTREMSVKAAFDQALEIESPDERQIWLERVYADRPDLQEKVEALLKSYDAAGSFVTVHGKELVHR